MRLTALRSIVVTLATVSLGACGSNGITDSSAQLDTSIGDAALFGVLPTRHPRPTDDKLIRCPTLRTVSTTSVVTPLLGGILSVAGTTVSIPAGAVMLPTTVTLTVPASRYMEIDVTALGIQHLVFQTPVTVTLSYARCTQRKLDRSPLVAWYIDSRTKALLERMGGVDDKSARTVTFSTGHLSGYALAN